MSQFNQKKGESNMLHLTGIKYMEKKIGNEVTRENIVMQVASYGSKDEYLGVYAHELDYAIAYKDMPIEGGTETCVGLGIKVFDDDLRDVFNEVWFREPEEPQGE